MIITFDYDNDCIRLDDIIMIKKSNQHDLKQIENLLDEIMNRLEPHKEVILERQSDGEKFNINSW